MSAELAKAAIHAALYKLQEAQFAIIESKSNATDIGIHLNTSSSAITDTIRAQLTAIGQLREAIATVGSALLGSNDTDATVVLVWLNQVDLTLQDDATQLSDLQRTIATQQQRTAEIVAHAEESVTQITNSANALRSHIATLG